MMKSMGGDSFKIPDPPKMEEHDGLKGKLQIGILNLNNKPLMFIVMVFQGTGKPLRFAMIGKALDDESNTNIKDLISSIKK